MKKHSKPVPRNRAASASIEPSPAMGESDISQLPVFKSTPINRSVFQKLTETIPVMIYVYGNSNKFLYVNPTFEEKLGYSRRELLDMNFWEIVHPDQKEMVQQRGMARLRGEDVPSNYEIKALRKNGDIIWGDVFFGLTELDGEPMAMVGVYDITARKHLEEELEKIHRHLEMTVEERTRELSKANQELTRLNWNLNNIIHNMSDGVLVMDRKGAVQMLNPGFARKWNIVLQDWARELKSILVSNPHGCLSKMLREGIPFQDEELILPTSRGQIHLLVSGTPLADDENQTPGGVVMVRPIQDVHRLVSRFSGARARFTFDDIVTQSSAMQEVIARARQASAGRSIVLVAGESGTGKEMFAHAIHNSSNRAKGPFVALNCGAIPRDLIGSELFGYVEGAFTGARRGGSPGKFELASGGTLFLDEIGDMPYEQQVSLLRVIQEQQFTRIGGEQIIPIDVRIVCATNRDLWGLVQEGNFRQDLYYRLNVIHLRIPPLRERPEDIPLLLDYFFSRWTSNQKEINPLLDPLILPTLISYHWPGNIRELQNLVEKAVHGSIPGDRCQQWLAENLPGCGGWRPFIPLAEQSGITISQVRQYQKNLQAEEERREIMRLMEKHRGNISRIAREMGVARSTIYRKMKESPLN